MRAGFVSRKAGVDGLVVFPATAGASVATKVSTTVVNKTSTIVVAYEPPRNGFFALVAFLLLALVAAAILLVFAFKFDFGSRKRVFLS